MSINIIHNKMNQTKERESGLYPVKYEGNLIVLPYNSTLQMWGDETEQYSEFDFEVIGELLIQD